MSEQLNFHPKAEGSQGQRDRLRKSWLLKGLSCPWSLGHASWVGSESQMQGAFQPPPEHRCSWCHAGAEGHMRTTEESQRNPNVIEAADYTGVDATAEENQLGSNAIP